MCLAQLIKNSPADAIKKILPKISNRLIEEITSPHTRCKAQIFECLLIVVL